ncbi:class I adenylate-forming enzyme family protein [Vulgatibacter sp.]|uniref:class I adenylate-forming enzyme family protein n=1 Tax=Vulgatibacter sp. TaxID=1971226 RepID=UPI003561DFB4
MGVNVGQILRQNAVRHPARVALVEGRGASRTTSTYGSIDERARRIAGGLLASGVGENDRVLLCAGNHEGFVAAFFGIVYAGAVVVPAPILSAPDEIALRVDRAGCRLALCDPEREALLRSAGTHGITIDALPEAAPLDLPRELDPGADAMILFTSGTTGEAKGARISHASLLVHTATLVHHTLRLDIDDRVLGALPLTHSFGCRMALLAPFFAGAVVQLVPRFDAAATLALLDEESITWAPVVPTMLAAWLRQPRGPPPRALHWVLSAGAPLPAELACSAEHRLGVPVRQGYGLTEATFSTVDGPPDAPVLGSVGRPVWGVEVRIVDADGATVGHETDGEIEVRGHNAMTGYLDDPEATAAVRDGAWLRTGDVGHLDAAGRLYVVDRKKDLILRGGNNVYPAEVEEVLCRHPGVAEVAVVGRPDPYYGEEVVAVVVPHDGADLRDLGSFAAAHLARTKVPRELVVIDELPLGPSGKVLKRVLRDRIAQGALAPRPLPHQS